MASGPAIHANLIEAERHIRLAADAGARLVVLPENFALMPMREQDILKARETDDGGPLQSFLSKQARDHRVWIVGGTIPMHGTDPKRARAASLVYSPTGERAARYDKIHLFDARIQDARGRYEESSQVEPGSGTVVVDSDVGRLGLSVCYDLRFPELYRDLVRQGAELLIVPAAFTAVTGRAHWEVLLRARAVENLCYVVAAAQGGYHANGRETHGDTLLCDPWGTVLDRLARGSGMVVASVDPALQTGIRDRLPVLGHRRL
jgi:nitrilase